MQTWLAGGMVIKKPRKKGTCDLAVLGSTPWRDPYFSLVGRVFNLH